MPSFPKPTFTFTYHVAEEKKALRTYRDTKPGRQIPKKAPNRLLIASWNIANLGAQDRRDKDHELIAEMVNWFDMIAIQEVKDDLSGLRGLQKHLPKGASRKTEAGPERLEWDQINRMVSPSVLMIVSSS